MAARIGIPGLLVGLLAGLAGPGCISAGKLRLLETFANDPVADLESPDIPRIARSQSPPAQPPPANAPPPGSSILYPPPLRPALPAAPAAPAATTTANSTPATAALPPPVAPPPAPSIQPVANKLATPESGLSGLSGRPAYQVKVAAWVNGQPIFSEDIEQAVPSLMQLRHMGGPAAAKRYNEIFSMVLEQFIDRELLYQDAMNKLGAVNPKAIKNLKEIQKKEFEKRIREIKATNHWTDEEFMQNLRRGGLTLGRMERMEEHRFFADEYLRSRVFPLVDRGTSYTALWEYYVDHQSEFQQLDSVDWHDIFIAIGSKRNPTREQAYQFATEIATRLRQGESLARLLEFDDGDSKSRKGEGAGHHPGQIQPPELARYLFSMREGDIGPIVEISTGFHIIRLIKREFAGPIPFDEKTQKLIRNKLRGEIFDREAKRIHRDLRSRAVIEKTPQ